MADQTNSDIINRLEELEIRVKAVEDTNAIRNLKARYAELCDDNYNPDGIAALFVEDAVWESGPLGRFEGREAIRKFFQGASEIFTFAIHYSLNSQIEVSGDSARARWYLFMPCTVILVFSVTVISMSAGIGYSTGCEKPTLSVRVLPLEDAR